MSQRSKPSKPSRPAAILFDLDGVLLRSEEVWFRLVEEAGRRYRGMPVSRAEFTPTFGQGTDADVRAFRLHCTPEQLDRFYVDHFDRYASHVQVDADARPVLEALKGAGIRSAVVTNTVQPLARSLVERAGVSSLVEVLSTADQVAHAKPAADLVEHALRGLGLRPGDAWMVGDSKFDRGAAGAAGVWFVGLRLDGDARIERLTDLLTLIPDPDRAGARPRHRSGGGASTR
jgi:phosphoglycolate phosphatase/AHBA synthesis associated protein